MCAVEMLQNLLDLRASQDYRQTHRLLCSLDPFKPSDLLLQHLLVKEKQSAQCLILSRWRHLPISGEMREKFSNFGFCHLFRMTLAVVDDEPLDPIGVSSLGSETVMFAAKHVANAVEQFRIAGRRDCR